MKLKAVLETDIPDEVGIELLRIQEQDREQNVTTAFHQQITIENDGDRWTYQLAAPLIWEPMT